MSSLLIKIKDIPPPPGNQRIVLLESKERATDTDRSVLITLMCVFQRVYHDRVQVFMKL